MTFKQIVSLIPAIVALYAIPAVAGTPSNSAAAFRTFDLYADRTAAVNVLDHRSSTYPGSLNSNKLLVTRAPGSADTVGIFRSRPNDFIRLEANAGQPLSYCDYAVNPPQYATSLGFLVMSELVFNGSGVFNDHGKPLLTATVTYADGDTSRRTLHVGYHIRDYQETGFSCQFQNIPFYIARPSDPLSGYIYEESALGKFYDVQEQLLAANRRSKKVTNVRVESVAQGHLCGVQIYSGERLHGLSLWPNFTLSPPVVRESQFTGEAHGGYLFGGNAVGTRRNTDNTACQVASMAMNYSYYGVACTVDQLNVHLRQNNGYAPDQVARITAVSPTGDQIRFTAVGKTILEVNNEFLVERGTYTNPLATYRVTVKYQADPFVSGQATRVTVHNATVPIVGDIGRVYWNLIPEVADRFTLGQLHTIDLLNATGSQVEDLLVRGIPVQLNVPGHMVVADGWTSSFRPDGSARGTYSIKDPFDTRNYTKLIEGKYRNIFGLARYVEPALLRPLAADSPTGASPPGLVLIASGASGVEIVDPLGRRMLRDAGSGAVVADVPEGSIEDLSSEHDNGDDRITGYSILIPTAIDGHYTLRIYADGSHGVSASAYDDNGVFVSDAVADTSLGEVGRMYDIVYSGAGQSVTITTLGSVGVNTVTSELPQLTVGTNPTRGPVQFVVARPAVSGDQLMIFDISGRRVDQMLIAPGGGSSQTLSWDWRGAGCRSGVYLARMASGNSATVRFIVLR